VKTDPRHRVKPGSSVLRSRLAEIEAESVRVRVEVERAKKLVKLAERGTDEAKPVATRIEDLLMANYDMGFTPAEVVEIVHASEDAVRKALHRLLQRGRIERHEHGVYAINAWDRARREREEDR